MSTLRGPSRFVSATINVPDIASSCDFYDEFVGLEPVSVSDDRAFLRAGLLHHAVCLESHPGIERAEVVGLTFEMESEADLEELEQRMTAAGCDPKRLGPEALPFSRGGISAELSAGIQWEFATGFETFVEPPVRSMNPSRIMHPFIICDEYEALCELFVGTVGFRVSDYVSDAVAFLRCEDRFHHSLAFMRTIDGDPGPPSVDHLSFIVDAFDDLMRARAKALYFNKNIKLDLVKHSGSTTIAFYLFEPLHGPQIELSFGHRVLTPEEHASGLPRRLSSGARTEIDLWRYSDDDWRGVGSEVSGL